jgi:glyoxylase-like metal-dependent hydrolase (beta-lactamase superfamily II)
MEVHEQGSLRLVKAGPLGPLGNNAYLIQDKESRETLLVDAPQDAEQILSELDGGNVVGIIITHRHQDHWMGIDAVKQATGAPVLCHADDAEPYAAKVDQTLADGDELSIGTITVTAIHTPGHTPGSTCFLVGDRLLSGDALFRPTAVDPIDHVPAARAAGRHCHPPRPRRRRPDRRL